ncbi:MAG: protein translocase subunit SecF [Sandaracinus sp.]|nr:protein translocase subunit SecF [Sandaracinus sp.]MCB9618449.1 protein translocase subunit SecF [Sandaracinus sp.]MCB9624408.1 protein translocase subunit SecF [Sandaracinus sp.]MCB9636238.1 protein translocase subunit SecF [Sandaracinus sp.]
MEIIKPGTYIDFMRLARPVITTTLLLSALAIVSLFFPGPNYGIDFAGGTEIQLAFNGEVSTAELRGMLDEVGHQGADVVKVEGQPNEFMIRVREVSSLTDTQREGLESAVSGAVGADVLRELRVSPGGDKLTLRLARDVDQTALREAIEGAGVNVRDISPLVGADDVRLEVFLVGIADEIVDQLSERLGERAPDGPERVEWVGPKAGQQLRDAAVKSLLFAIAFIMVYVAFRFDLRFAPGGVIAMFHDALITLGIYVLVQKEVNLTTVAAVLTVIGYSINDTIVVYDRIRENMGRYNDKTLREIINLSTSQTLSRTIVTSGTTLLSIVAFFIWGTPVIQDISFALFVGIVIGTYSSIYVAAPITEWMDRRFFSKPARAAAVRTARA